MSYIIQFTSSFTTGQKSPFLIDDYRVNGPKSPGNPLPDLNSDNTTTGNTLATSLVIYGKHMPNWGEKVEENIIHIMEHFCDDTPPVFPTKGQKWFDSTSGRFMFFNGVDWASCDSVIASAVAPTDINSTNPNGANYIITIKIGQLWYDTVNQLLKIYNGTSWVVTDGNYILKSGDLMDVNANLTFNGGEILGLPNTPTTLGSATSKFYVDNNYLNLNGGILTGEVFGIPSIPSANNAIASKVYVDNSISNNVLASNVQFTPYDELISTNVQNALEELQDLKLSYTGGVFNLTSEVNFGNLFGLKTLYYSTTTLNSALTGEFRLSNNDTINFRNLTNTSDIPLGVGSSDNILSFNSIDIVNISTNQTISNKTLITPIINSMTINGGIFSPTPTQGNVIVGNGTNFVSLSVGNNNQILSANSTELNGVEWVNPIFITTEQYGAIGDGITIDTIALNNAITAAIGKILIIKKPSNFYLIDDDLILNSNTTIYFEPGVLIKTTAGSFGSGEAILFMNLVDNITIYGNGCVLQGLREGTGFSLISFGVKIAGSTNITIRDVNSIDASGDGFIVQGADDNSILYSNNIYLENCIADNNMRQGISVVGARNLTCINCDFENTNGKSPSAGVDIEPDSTAELYNIKFITCKSSGNEGNQWLIDLNGMVNDVDIVLDNCLGSDGISPNSKGFEVSNAFLNLAPNSRILLNNCIAKNMDSYGLLLRNLDKTGVPVIVQNMQLIDTNLQQRTEYGGINTPFLIYSSSNVVFNPSPGNIHINGIKIIDNTVDRTPYAIVSDITPHVDIFINNLEWKNTIGMTSIPYAQDGSSNFVISWKQGIFEVNRTSDTVLTSRWNGWRFNNKGDTNIQTFSLPNPILKGMFFEFEVYESQIVRILPNINDRLNPFATNNGKYMESNTPGSTAIVRANSDATDWVVSRNGVWIDEP